MLTVHPARSAPAIAVLLQILLDLLNPLHPLNPPWPASATLSSIVHQIKSVPMARAGHRFVAMAYRKRGSSVTTEMRYPMMAAKTTVCFPIFLNVPTARSALRIVATATPACLVMKTSSAGRALRAITVAVWNAPTTNSAALACASAVVAPVAPTTASVLPTGAPMAAAERARRISNVRRDSALPVSARNVPQTMTAATVKSASKTVV